MKEIKKTTGTVLLAESDEKAVIPARLGLLDLFPHLSIQPVNSGQECLEYLKGSAHR